MGRTAKSLSNKQIGSKSVFHNRFVVEVCEKMHFHYRNLRINLSLPDFLELARGIMQAYDRFIDRGSPEPRKGEHIELCRKKVATDVCNDGVQINLNKNLYPLNKDRIYAEGAVLGDAHYIHIKIRDLRIELSLADYEVLSNAIKEADQRLKDSDTCALLQKA
jgi:hypothetical protein